MPPSDNEIRAAAIELKAALDGIDRVHWERVYIDRYPRGSCGHCAELLAFHLNQRFGIVPDYVCAVFYGEDGTRETSHAWIEWNGLIVDISGDQFGWPPVIVSRHSPQHERGNADVRYPWKLDPSWWGTQCGDIWGAAQAWLSSNSQTVPSEISS